MLTTGVPTFIAPVAVSIDFYLHRPASAPKHRTVPNRRPDLDKLVRGVLDALTIAGAIEDDARVVELVARKHYGIDWTGAVITITELVDRTGPVVLSASTRS